MASLRIDVGELDRIKRASGITSNRDLAEKLGVDKSTVSRVVSGRAEPGSRFIAAALLTLATSFDALFVVEADKSESDEAAA